MPKRRLRDWLSVQVSTRSPKPAIPIRWRIGTKRCAKPRHFGQSTRDSAVRAFARSRCRQTSLSRQSCITFFTAPPSCTPIKSALQHAKTFSCSATVAGDRRIKVLSAEASGATAVGKPAASFLANVGPEITASGISDA